MPHSFASEVSVLDSGDSPTHVISLFSLKIVLFDYFVGNLGTQDLGLASLSVV